MTGNGEQAPGQIDDLQIPEKILIGRLFGSAKAMPTVAAGIFIFPATGNAHAIGAD